MTQPTAIPAPPLLFVLDTNVLIEAAKRYYAFDLVPKFWDGLLQHGAAGCVCTIDRVADEIRAGQDDLTNWMDRQFMPHVKASNQHETLGNYGALMQWCQAQASFTPAAKAEFATATVADAWLIAYAEGVGGTLVTHETFDGNCRRRVKIPNACQHLGVQFVDLFSMIRALGIKIGGD